MLKDSLISKSRQKFRPPPRSIKEPEGPQDDYSPSIPDDAVAVDHGLGADTKFKMALAAGLSLFGAFSAGSSKAAAAVMVQPLQLPAKTSQLIDGSVSPSDQKILIRQMKDLPQEVVQLMADTGLKIKVAKQGDKLLDTGAITILDRADIISSAPKDAEAIQNLETFPSKTWSFEHSISQATQGRWRLFRDPSGKLGDEITLTELARSHGFTSTADISWFQSQVEAANSKTLQAARQNPLNKARYEATLKGRKARKAKERLERYEADPSSIPITWKRYALAVPDWHRAKLGKEDVDVTIHDLQTIEKWTNLSDKVSTEDQFLGQYFGEDGKHLVVMTRAGMRKSWTANHEIGHAVEVLAGRNAGAGFSNFKIRLQAAHNGVKPRGEGIKLDPDGGKHHDHGGRKQISDYSRTNPREYFAEGFAHYVEDPTRLKEKDAKLFELVEEGIRLALGTDTGVEASLQQ